MTTGRLALRCLRDLADKAGGQSGWASAVQIEAALERPPGEALRCLSVLGYVECSGDGEERLYRVSDEGLHYLAAVDRFASPPRSHPCLPQRIPRPLTSGG